MKSDSCEFPWVITGKKVTKCEKCEFNDDCPQDLFHDAFDEALVKFMEVLKKHWGVKDIDDHAVKKLMENMK